MQLPDQAAKACEPDKPCLCQKCSVNADDFLTCPREACLPMPVVLPSSAPDGFEVSACHGIKDALLYLRCDSSDVPQR